MIRLLVCAFIFVRVLLVLKYCDLKLMCIYLSERFYQQWFCWHACFTGIQHVQNKDELSTACSHQSSPRRRGILVSCWTWSTGSNSFNIRLNTSDYLTLVCLEFSDLTFEFWLRFRRTAYACVHYIVLIEIQAQGLCLRPLHRFDWDSGVRPMPAFFTSFWLRFRRRAYACVHYIVGLTWLDLNLMSFELIFSMYFFHHVKFRSHVCLMLFPVMQISVDISSDVCLKAEASPRGSKSAASALLQRFRGLGLVSTLGIGTSKLRYDIIIHNFHPFIFCILCV